MLRRPAFMLLALSLVVAAGACGRSDPRRDAPGAAGLQGDGQQVSMPPLDAYRMFYCDTAIQGNTLALMCAYNFFGADHMVFATDSPYDSRFGERVCSETVPAVEAMAIPDADKEKIFHGNARRLFRLPG